MTPDQRTEIEARLDARLEELIRTRAAMRRSAEGSRDSEVAHLDNHPADLGTELHDEELDETTEIFFRRGGAAHRRGPTRARRRAPTASARRAAARSRPSGCAPCPRPCAASTVSAASRASTGSRRGPDRVRVVVTGATGFIGSHVARLALERGDEVRARRGGRLERRRDRGPRLPARAARGGRPALGAPGAPRGRARLPLRRRDLGAPARRRARLPRERGRHEARDGGVPARRGRARGLHLERGGGGAGRAREARPTRRSSSPPGGSGSRT